MLHSDAGVIYTFGGVLSTGVTNDLWSFTVSASKYLNHNEMMSTLLITIRYRYLGESDLQQRRAIASLRPFIRILARLVFGRHTSNQSRLQFERLDDRYCEL